ncbi:GAF domain-containing protein [Ruminiclostridium sufflavum DSM 19573]|uniref:GAF domain-containing protein n=1 Tax=Ruminiclostridium sufflavum DSM 19573 TaxID=1121337 RepID=A0A318XS00_9FIRM|nr:GAF domain-containing protein [Ruminiclostridium sufflavum]PYG89021.1 GAF domain-containing protein [Ruminiclostridium sufflavum DSM 19573]
MDYDSILKRIEKEKKDEALSAKLYRYTGLVQAIEFFSQRLVFDQIVDAAFDFINELLLVKKSAIYILENHTYVPKKVKGFSTRLDNIELSIELNDLATYYGNILYERENLIKFLKPEFIDSLEINAVVPLIIEDSLYGIILFQNNNNSFGEDDYIISESLMRLINTALENFNRYEKLARINTELDEKIFNLFAINQSSKVLLSDLRIDSLYDIAVDVFSELTHSKITGFILFDERRDRYTLKSFKDIFYKVKNVTIRLLLKGSCKVNPNKIIINLKNKQDCEYFNSLFEEDSVIADAQLEQLEAMYVVLLLKNRQILGFVTLSETVTGSEYGDGIFELIESLAASTYTAISNAKLFEMVNEQKALIQRKLDKLISLNYLTRNISSSIRIETLQEIATKTLQVSFNVNKGAFCIYKKETNEFEFSNTINIEGCKGKNVKPNQKWKRIFEGDCVYALGQSTVAEYLGEEFIEDIGEVQGVLIIPIYLDMMETDVLGAIIIFGYTDVQLDNEENMLIIDTIAGNIAPVLNNLLIIQMQQRFTLPNYIELFKRDLKDEVNAALDYGIELSVIQAEDQREFLFKGNSAVEGLKENFKKVYPFSYNNIFIIENSVDEVEIMGKIKECTKFDNMKIKIMKLGAEFKNFAEFFELYR